MTAVDTRRHDALIESALHYARRGRAVFPVHTVRRGRCSCGQAHASDPRQVAKHPRTERGLLDATTDDAMVKRWWTECPDANVAIRPSPAPHGEGVR